MVTPYYDHAGIRIYHGDCREVLPHLEPVDLLFTSPPYLDRREYGGQLSEPWDAIVPPALASAPMSEAGQVIVNLGLVHRDGELVPYWDALIAAMRAAGFRHFGWYVWDQGFALPGMMHGRLAPSHEWLFHFNRTAVEPAKTERSSYAGRTHRGYTVRDERGVMKPKTWDGRPYGERRIHDSLVRIPRHNGPGENDHPAAMPIGLPRKILSFWPGVVCDPFMGSGTTLRAAKDAGRRAIGIEIEERYCEIAAKRMAQETLFGAEAWT
jgi:DNA modification methylase